MFIVYTGTKCSKEEHLGEAMALRHELEYIHEMFIAYPGNSYTKEEHLGEATALRYELEYIGDRKWRRRILRREYQAEGGYTEYLEEVFIHNGLEDGALAVMSDRH